MLHRIGSGMLALGMALALAGCGGGGGGGSGASSTGTGTGAGSSAGSSTPATPTGSTAPTLAAATAVIDGTTLGIENWQAGSTSTGGTGQAVSGLNCAVAGNSYKYTHLSIYENGQQLALPANIGTVQPTVAAPTGCVYPLNTVDETGKIRMDESNNATYTLGQFFAIWGQPIDTTNVAGIGASSVTVYVNNGGALSKYTGDLASLVLPAQGEITIVIGTPLAQIPTYTWTDPPPFDPNPVTLIYGGTVGTTTYWPNGNRPTGGTGADVDGITCAPNMVETYHVHAHLAIIYNGQWLQMPENIGITSSCYYEMHMHDHTGMIHIEAPAVKDYTLGKFFDIWGEPLTSTNVAGISGNVVAYINDNGEARRYMGDLREIRLTSHRDITLQIGTPALTTLPTYTWADQPK